MATLLFANNALSTLAGPLTQTATTCQVAAGTGVLFPAPAANQLFKLTFTDAATGNVTEICHCTARNGDTLTIVRGQENTAAQVWAAGDHADNLLTAQTLLAFAQSANLSSSFFQGTAGGTASNLTVDGTNPANPAPTNGQIFAITKNNTDNDGPVTLKIPTVGGQALSVLYADGSALAAKDLPANSTVFLYCTGGVYQVMGVLNSPGLKTFVGTDTSLAAAPNDVVLTATQPASGLNVAPGQVYLVYKSPFDNTGAMTFKTTASAVLPLKKLGGTDLHPKDWPANTPMMITIVTLGGVLTALAMNPPRLNFPNLPLADEAVAANDVFAYYDTSEARHVQRPASTMPFTTHIGDDTSAASNTITVPTLDVPITAYVKGHKYRIKLANDITGATTASINGLPGRNVLRADGSALQAKDGIAGQEFEIIDDGARLLLSGTKTPAQTSVYLQMYNNGQGLTNATSTRIFITPVGATPPWMTFSGGNTVVIQTPGVYSFTINAQLNQSVSSTSTSFFNLGISAEDSGGNTLANINANQQVPNNPAAGAANCSLNGTITVYLPAGAVVHANVLIAEFSGKSTAQNVANASFYATKVG